ncbi:MAG TPA: hypothetical protein VFS05_11390 [Gemmatimonadaceae bacterium]|nr:hypothetical protein [Gemmatimonadaceae bacterium]
MPATSRRGVRAAPLALALLAALSCAPKIGADTRAAAQGIPARLGDRAFWRLVTELSEEGGVFRSDNFVSNEVAFQHVIPELARRAPAGGVYLGVGPDQNFSYVVALRPKLAFIIDIRRQNMLQHLLFKALIEPSSDRADFVAHLFSRRRPRALTPAASAGASAEALFAAFEDVPPDSVLFHRNLAAVRRRLVEEHHFPLTREDLGTIEYIYRAFFEGGPELTYTIGTGGAQRRWRRMPSYAQLIAETDGEGVQRSYLASEAHFRTLRELQRNNLVVPLVGDFAGEKTIRAVGRWLAERGAKVTAFYTSNVEQYLFRQGDDWRLFFDNVAALPVDSASVFIRAVFDYSYDPYTLGSMARSETMLCPIAPLLAAVSDGRVQSYYDIVELSRAAVPGPVPP